MGLLRKGLASATRTKEIIEVVGANEAAEATLTSAQPGELVLLQADTIDETVQWLQGLSRSAGREKRRGQRARTRRARPQGVEPPPPKKLAPAEIESEILAEVQTVAKF